MFPSTGLCPNRRVVTVTSFQTVSVVPVVVRPYLSVLHLGRVWVGPPEYLKSYDGDRPPWLEEGRTEVSSGRLGPTWTRSRVLRGLLHCRWEDV